MRNDGVDPKRIVFAPHMPHEEHLARIRNADIALDTFPCTSHTTASDALWAGVPLVTHYGDTFASRVAASVLNAAGCAEWAFADADRAFDATLALARNRDLRAQARQKLASTLRTSPLSDIDGYVRKASERLRDRVTFPAGCYMQWAGQFQYLKEAEQRLKFVVPLTLLIIFVLIYMNTRSVLKTFIVLLAVPFSLVGAFWLIYLLGYNMSIAVWVGLIALAGLDAETGVVMLLYLDHAWDKFRAAGKISGTMHDLRSCIWEA